VIIPYKSLSDDALASIIEAFVLREGTDYGVAEAGLAKKCDQVRSQLQRGEAAINFDPTTETIDIRPNTEMKRGKQHDTT
jgi:uncharacterized protein YheU (UPF0270 family)